MHALRGHNAPVLSVAYAPDGRTFASGDESGLAIIWDLATGERLDDGNLNEGQTLSLSFSPDSRKLAIAFRRQIFLWDREQNQGRPFQLDLGGSSVLSFSPDGTQLLATAYLDSVISVIDPVNEHVFGWLRGHRGSVLALTHDPSVPRGRFVTAGGMAGIVVLDLWENDRVVRSLTGHEAPVYSLAFAPCGSLLASGSRDRTVRLWNTETGEALTTLGGHDGTIAALAFTPDGRSIISATTYGTVCVWDAHTARRRISFDFDIGQVRSIAISPDGLTAAAGGSDHSVLVWDLD
jgi:WD40 repeat protein